jgi:hypothetical protein
MSHYEFVEYIKTRKNCQYQLFQLSKEMETYKGGSRGYSWMPEDDVFYYISNIYECINRWFHNINIVCKNNSFQKFIKNSLRIGRDTLQKLREMCSRVEYVCKLEKIFRKYRRNCLTYFKNQTYIKLLLVKKVPLEIIDLINKY